MEEGRLEHVSKCMRQVEQLWSFVARHMHVLPTKLRPRTVGALVDVAFAWAVECLLRLEDIGADEATELASLLERWQRGALDALCPKQVFLGGTSWTGPPGLMASILY